MSSIVRSVILDIVGRDNASRAFLSAAKAAETAATATDRSILRMQAAGYRTQAIGQKLTKGLTLPLLALGAYAVDQSAKFETSLNTIRVATEHTVADMDVFRKGIEKLAVTTGDSFDQLSEGAYIAAKTFKAPADALNVLSVAAKGARAEGVDLKTAVTALTSIMASYGVKASGATQIENEMIRASGLAKTTFSDFAGSLSTIAPLTGSLGISFAELGGAIATMTQHGESAQQATENLRNLVTNLAGQNNIASQAMQQLGINVIDLQKHLGDRGLTGTLGVVLNALRANGKDGLVVYNSFKQAALGTESLQIMLGKMNGALKAQSEAFLKGTVSGGDYRKFAKSLGGTQFAMGMQFLAATRAQLGFNNLLKSGRGNQQTYAKALQTVLGGVTGMGAALKLLGPEFAKNKNSTDLWLQNVNAINKVSKSANTSVLGWALSQKQLSTQWDITKQKFHLFLIELGEKLAPTARQTLDFLQKVFGWLGKVATAFGGLGAKIAIIGIILGPILSIFGRFVVLIGGIAKAAVGFYRLQAAIRGVALSTDAMNTGAYRAGSFIGNLTGKIRGLSGAMLGITAGTAIGLTAGTGTGGWLMSVFGGAAAGGAFGSVFGGVGALTGLIGGGLAGAISHGIKLWNDHGDAAKAALAAEKADVANLTTAILQDNGALAKNTQATIVKMLGDKGALADAVKAGIGPSVLADAILGKPGNTQAIAAHGSQIARDINSILSQSGYLKKGAYNFSLNDLEKAGTNFLNNAGYNALSKSQQQTIDKLLDEGAAYQKVVAELKKYGIEINNAQKAANLQLHTLNDGKKLTGGFTAQLKELSKGTVVATDANQNLNHSLSASTVLGQHNRDLIAQLGKAARDDAVYTANRARANHSLADSVKIGNDRLAANVKAIEAAAKAQGFNKQAVDKLLTDLGVLNKTDIKPKSLVLRDDKIRAQITDLQKRLDKIAKGADPSINPKTAQGHALLAQIQQQIDTLKASLANKPTLAFNDEASGVINGVLSKVRGLFSLVLNPPTLRIPSNGLPNNGSVLPQPGQPTKTQSGNGNAKGGWILGPGSETSDSILARLSNGEFVVRAKQARKHHRLLEMINAGRLPGFAGGGDASKASSAIGAIGQAYSARFTLTDTGLGLPRLAAQIKAAFAILNEQIHKGLSSATTASFRRQINALRAYAQQQLYALKVNIRSSDVANLTKTLTGTVDAAKTAFDSFIAHVKSIGASSAQLATLRAAESNYLRTQNTLVNAKQYRSDIENTLRGTFDSTKFGSVTDFLQGIGAATQQNNTYASQVNALRAKAKGNTTLLSYINTLAANGETATLQTLSGASKSQLAQITKAVSAYNASVGAGGNAAEQAKFGQSVNELVHEQQETIGALKELAIAFATAGFSLDGHALDKHADARIERALRKLLATSKNGHHA